ncbi:ubiquinone anaerobic biosynthesis protein UbiU [Magnetococcales bacterium HHB-1]
MEILAPAGNLPSLKAAVQNGADAVYLGFRNATNARNFEGLNFSEEEVRQGIRFAHQKGAKVNITINTNPLVKNPEHWYQAVDQVAESGADAIILANIALLRYTKKNYPKLPIHLSVQASASNFEAIDLYQRHFGVRRVILPRVLTLDQIKALRKRTNMELETFAFGGLCVMTEGRCFLSSFVTGVSPNIEGVCSPARMVRFENDQGKMRTRLSGQLIAEYEKGEQAAYPTVCKGLYNSQQKSYHVMESPGSLNVLKMLPEFIEAGISCLKIEGRQRTKSYVSTVTRVMRQAVDHYYKAPERFYVKGSWQRTLNQASEGAAQTTGVYQESWL